MIRALTTLVGFACAAALLLLVADTGSAEGGGLWQRAALIAGAGLVAGAFYQLGGIRRPGVRINLPLFIGAFVPWTLLAVAICAHKAGTPVWMADLANDVLPNGWLARWSPSFPVLAFVSGMLLAFALVEPVVRVRAQVVEARDEGVAPARPLDVTEAPEPELEPVHSVR